jgi:hypothetical protein
MKTFGVVWLLAVAAFALPRQAAADSTRGVFALQGDLDGADLVVNAASSRMQAAGWTSEQIDKREAQGLFDCFNAAGGQCLPKSLHARGVRGAIVFRAENKSSANGERVVELVGKIMLGDRPEFVVLNRRCDACNDDTLAKTSSSLTEALLQRLAVQLGRTLVSVRSNPQGANVLVDSDMVGATPVVAKTFPGEHVVQIQKAGYVTATRKVVAADGATQDVGVELTLVGPGRGTPSDPHDTTARRPWGPIAMVAGGGLLALGVGGSLIYVGQLGGRDDPYRYPHATTAGIIVGVVGLGLAATGAWLWRHDSKKTRGPTLDATHSGAVVGWGGTF